MKTTQPITICLMKVKPGKSVDDYNEKCSGDIAIWLMI